MAKQAKTALDGVLNHLLHNVLPAARDYEAAEDVLSLAFKQNPDPTSWEQQGQQAKSRRRGRNRNRRALRPSGESTRSQ